MNFIYYKSLRDKKVNHALINAIYEMEKAETGQRKFPLEWKNYGLIDLSRPVIKIQYARNSKEKEKLKDRLQYSKEKEILLFNWWMSLKGKESESGIISTSNEDDYKNKYTLLIRRVKLMNTECVENHLIKKGIVLPDMSKFSEQKKEGFLFLHDFILAHEDVQNKIMSYGTKEFIILETSKDSGHLQNIYFGSNGETMSACQEKQKFVKIVGSIAGKGLSGGEVGFNGRVIRINKENGKGGDIISIAKDVIEPFDSPVRFEEVPCLKFIKKYDNPLDKPVQTTSWQTRNRGRRYWWNEPEKLTTTNNYGDKKVIGDKETYEKHYKIKVGVDK